MSGRNTIYPEIDPMRKFLQEFDRSEKIKRVKDLMIERALGKSYNQLGKEFGVSPSTARNICVQN